MFIEILAFLHHGTTLLFGIYISALFLGIRMTRKNITALFGFACIVGIVYALTFVMSGENVAKQIYPLIIHLPLILFLHFFYKYKTMLCIFSVFTAYLCCQISNWICRKTSLSRWSAAEQGKRTRIRYAEHIVYRGKTEGELSILG